MSKIKLQALIFSFFIFFFVIFLGFLSFNYQTVFAKINSPSAISFFNKTPSKPLAFLPVVKNNNFVNQTAKKVNNKTSNQDLPIVETALKDSVRANPSLVDDLSYILPVSISTGGDFTMYYRVYNPTGSYLRLGLGASIISGSGNTINDPYTSDYWCTVPAGATTWCSRTFQTGSSITAGTYDVVYAIWSDVPGSSTWYDSEQKNDILTIARVNYDPTLTGVSVSPESGTTNDTYTYQATYFDSDGDWPSYIRVNIDCSGGSCTKPMNYYSGNPSSGAIYKFSTTLTATNHSFYIDTSDGNATYSSGVIWKPSVVAYNASPYLTSASVNPTSGYRNTNFVYKVTYYDSDNDAPTKYQINIDGGAWVNMSKTNYFDNTYTDGVEYQYTISGLAIGQHSYGVAFNDGKNGHADQTSGQSGPPSVSNRYPITNSGVAITPTSGTTNQEITQSLSWNGYFSDPDNDSLAYDVYFGTSSSNLIYKTSTGTTSYSPGTLAYDTTYYWQIKAKDGWGGETSGPIWNFRTKPIVRANLKITVSNIGGQGGIPGSNGIVKLYDQNGNYLPQSNETTSDDGTGRGVITFSNLPLGNYTYKVYFLSGGWGQEYWGQKSINLNTDGEISDSFIRNEPYGMELNFVNSATGVTVNTSNPLLLGQSVKAKVKVKNPNPTTIPNIFAKVRIKLSGGNYIEVTTGTQTLTAGQEYIFESPVFTPNTTGFYDYTSAIFAYSDSKMTDSWLWTTNVFQVIKDVEFSIDSPEYWTNRLGNYLQMLHVPTDVTYKGGETSFIAKLKNTGLSQETFHVYGAGIKENPCDPFHELCPGPDIGWVNYTLAPQQEISFEVNPVGIFTDEEQGSPTSKWWRVYRVSDGQLVSEAGKDIHVKTISDYGAWVASYYNTLPGGGSEYIREGNYQITRAIASMVVDPFLVLTDPEKECFQGRLNQGECSRAFGEVILLLMPVAESLTMKGLEAGETAVLRVDDINSAAARTTDNKNVLESLSDAVKRLFNSKGAVEELSQGIKQAKVLAGRSTTAIPQELKTLSNKEIFIDSEQYIKNILTNHEGTNAEKLIAKALNKVGARDIQISYNGNFYSAQDIILNRLTTNAYKIGNEEAGLYLIEDNSGNLFFSPLDKAANKIFSQEIDGTFGLVDSNGKKTLYIVTSKVRIGTGAAETITYNGQPIVELTQNLAGNLNTAIKIHNRGNLARLAQRYGYDDVGFINYIGNIKTAATAENAVRPLTLTEEEGVKKVADAIEENIITIDTGGFIINAWTNHTPGTYSYPVIATIKTDKPAIAHYTTDGSQPNLNSTIYTSPIPITQNTTVNYFVIDENGNHSSINSANYIILNPGMFPAPYIGTNDGQDYQTNDPQINLRGNTFIETTQILVNGNTNGVSFTSKTDEWAYAGILNEGENIISIVAKSDAGVFSHPTTIKITLDTTAPNPSVDIGSGVYPTAKTVTLFSDDSTAKIYYTLDGTEPTTDSALYSEPLHIDVNTTLKYFAIDPAGNQSETKTEIYQVPTFTLNLTRGWNMISVPMGLSDLSRLGANSAIWRYDNNLGQYVSVVDQLLPGEGYLAWIDEPRTVLMPLLPFSSGHYPAQNYSAGWILASSLWLEHQDILVITSENQTYTLVQAINEGIISSRAQYLDSDHYDLINLFTATPSSLVGKSMWLYSTKPISFSFGLIERPIVNTESNPSSNPSILPQMPSVK